MCRATRADARGAAAGALAGSLGLLCLASACAACALPRLRGSVMPIDAGEVSSEVRLAVGRGSTLYAYFPQKLRALRLREGRWVSLGAPSEGPADAPLEEADVRFRTIEDDCVGVEIAVRGPRVVSTRLPGSAPAGPEGPLRCYPGRAPGSAQLAWAEVQEGDLHRPLGLLLWEGPRPRLLPSPAGEHTLVLSAEEGELGGLRVTQVQGAGGARSELREWSARAGPGEPLGSLPGSYAPGLRALAFHAPPEGAPARLHLVTWGEEVATLWALPRGGPPGPRSELRLPHHDCDDPATEGALCSYDRSRVEVLGVSERGAERWLAVLRKRVFGTLSAERAEEQSPREEEARLYWSAPRIETELLLIRVEGGHLRERRAWVVGEDSEVEQAAFLQDPSGVMHLVFYERPMARRWGFVYHRLEGLLE